MDRLERRLIQLKIEREAVKKDEDEAAAQAAGTAGEQIETSSGSTRTSRRSGKPRRLPCRERPRSRARSSR
jgi:hypothetical protein